MNDHDARIFRWPYRWKMWKAIWGERHEIDYLPDCDDGMPRVVLAYRRVRDHLLAWRDRHEADDDPWYDEGKELFHVSDVAILFAEYQRLERLETDVSNVLGPPLVGYVWRNGKYVRDDVKE
jgi:hypothetical protein